MHHNRIIAARQMIDNLRSAGETSRADYIEELMNECLRLRQGLWDVAKICGADLDGNETPRSLDSDVVAFTIDAATDLRRSEADVIDRLL